MSHFFLRRFVISGLSLFFAFSPTIYADFVDITGGDPGEGLTLDLSNVLYAVDVVNNEAITIQGQVFTSDAATPNVTATYNSSSTGTVTFASPTADDQSMANLLRSIAVGSGNNVITLSIGGLTVGGQYRLELLCSNAGFNSRRQSVTINGVTTDQGVVLEANHVNIFNTFTATSGTATVSINGAPDGKYPDPIPVLSGFVVTVVPEPGVSLLLGAGIVAALSFRWARRRYFSN